MIEHRLTDPQWCVLDLLMRARSKGVDRLNRIELLSSPLPRGAAIKLVFAALVMPDDLVEWVGAHDFRITDAGASLYNLRFGSRENPSPTPTSVADAVICLPGPGVRQ